MKKIFFSLFVMVLLMVCFQMMVSAAPSNGEVFSLRQPDNSYVNVKVFGDEFYQRVESLDGYTLIREPDTNWICYAQFNDEKDDFVSTGIRYTGDSVQSEVSTLVKGQKLELDVIEEKAADTKKIFLAPAEAEIDSVEYEEVLPEPNTSQQNILGLTIMIKFPDVDTDIGVADVEDMLNKEGYTAYNNNGSVRDYFYDVSGGIVVYKNHVTDFYVAKNAKSYYDSPEVEIGTRATELIKEALDDLDSKFDFSTLTTDSKKRVLAVNVLYAGSPEAGWGKGLWAHYGTFENIYYADGVGIRKYQISPLRDSLNISTFVHENGHMLFNWPDLYDYDGDSKGLGRYCIMAYTDNTGNPVPPNPFLRNVWCGWGNVTDLNGLPNRSKITAEAGTDVFRFAGSNPNEYYLIENISKTGRWSNMPDEGLLVWHIDETGNNDWQNMTYDKHYIVSVEQADGRYDLEKNINYGDTFDLFGQFESAFTDLTVPSSKWWNGQPSGLNIMEISKPDNVMTFRLSSTPSYVLGDIDGDGTVSAIDLAYMKKKLLGMPIDNNEIIFFDLNGDELVDALDFACMRKYLLGFIKTFPVEEE